MIWGLFIVPHPRKRCRADTMPPRASGGKDSTFVLPLVEVEAADYAHRTARCADPIGSNPPYRVSSPTAEYCALPAPRRAPLATGGDQRSDGAEPTDPY
jgi:hypothetical protein